MPLPTVAYPLWQSRGVTCGMLLVDVMVSLGVNEAVINTEPVQWPVRDQAALVPIGPGTSGATQPDKVYLAKLRVSHT